MFKLVHLKYICQKYTKEHNTFRLLVQRILTHFFPKFRQYEAVFQPLTSSLPWYKAAMKPTDNIRWYPYVHPVEESSLHRADSMCYRPNTPAQQT